MAEENDLHVKDPIEKDNLVSSHGHGDSPTQEIPAAVTSKPESETDKFSTRLRQFPSAELEVCSEGNSSIGVGGFGNVRKYYHKDKVVAIKEFAIKGDDGKINKIWNMVLREANTLCRFHHENIVEILGVTQWQKTVGIIMEFVKGGSLESLLSEENQKVLPWNTRLRIAKGITSGLNYIHNHREKKTFCHGDIKPANILLTLSLQVKLADFGSAAFHRATEASTTTVKYVSSKQFTLIYVAPEFLEDTSLKKTPSMDMYSFGMVLYELISRQLPYSDTSMPVHVPALILAKVKPSIKLIDNAESQLETDDDRAAFRFLKKLMQSCWDENPKSRPSSKTVEMELSSYLLNQNQGLSPRIYGSQKISSEAASGRENASDVNLPKQTSCAKAKMEKKHKATGIAKLHDLGRNATVQELLAKYTDSLLNQNFQQADSLKATLRTLLTDELRAEPEDVKLFGEKLHDQKNYLQAIAIFDTAAALFSKLQDPDKDLERMQICVQALKSANEKIIEEDFNMKKIVREHVIPLMRSWLRQMKSALQVSEKWRCRAVGWALCHIDLCETWVQQYEEGKQALEEAISEMVRVFGHDDAHKQHGRLFGTLLTNLGVNYKRESRFEEAAALFEESIEAHQAGFDYFGDEEQRKRDIEISERALKSISRDIWEQELKRM